MQLVVEFFGMARRLAGAKETTVELPEGATLRDVARAIGRRHPKLVGPLIEPHSSDLAEPYVFSHDGRFVSPTLDVAVEPGERLVLMFPPAGG